MKKNWNMRLAAFCGAAVVMTLGAGCGQAGGQTTKAAQETRQAAGAVQQMQTSSADQDIVQTQAGSAEQDIVQTQADGAVQGTQTGGSIQKMQQSQTGVVSRTQTGQPLPSRYDGREHGRTAPAKDQGDLGTCWAFASLQALKSSLLPEEKLDFSEDHMTNNPDFILGQKEGGEYTMSMAYLLAWQGPVLEQDDPYGDGVSPNGLKPVKHVQEVQLLPAGDQAAIKRAVMEYGGVQSSLYTNVQGREDAALSGFYNQETKGYYYPADTKPNHDVVIVGWDDTFPKEAFRGEVPGDGAFLCENSWGTQFGDGGFFYVSYYDANLGKVNVAYTGVENVDNYDRLYQSDRCGWVGQAGYGAETAWAVNVFRAGKSERLEAAGFYAIDRDSDYEVYVVRRIPERIPFTQSTAGEQEGQGKDGQHRPGQVVPESWFSQRRLVASGHLDYAGYYTVPFDRPEDLQPGERFGIVLKMTTPGAIHPIAIEYDAQDGKCSIDLEDGEGYISPDGSWWENLESGYYGNLCMKAYTSYR